jgi:G:T-mismatch repair DNA endonuclease (very short patch repair protein)
VVRVYVGEADKLADTGWSVLTLWGCEFEDEANLAGRVRPFLS